MGAHMAGAILAILMLGVQSRRIRVPNSRSNEELQHLVGPSVDTGQADIEAEGLQLHVSTHSNTGYRGVHKTRENKFKVDYKGKYLGIFATALEAAVVYAKAVGSTAEVHAFGLA